MRTLVLIDESRKDEFAGGPRTLVTEVWYPAADESRGKPASRFAEFFGPYGEEAGRVLKKKVEEIETRFRSSAVRDAPLRQGRWPLLVFSHGNGGFRHQNVFQVEHLASHGYLVAAPDHTGNAGLSPLPGKAVGYDRRGRVRSAEDRPRDVTFLLDRLTACDLPELRWLEGSADPAALGVLGHSFGGLTAAREAELDRRVKAALAMTVAFGKPTSVPTLVMLGAEDRTVGAAGNLASRGYFLNLEGPRYLFVLRRGGHFTFTEMGVINPEFGDGIGRGKGQDGQPMDFIPVPLAKEIIDAYTLAFFEAHLRGSAGALRFLSSNHYPEELEWVPDGRLEKAPGKDTPKPADPSAEPPRRARI